MGYRRDYAKKSTLLMRNIINSSVEKSFGNNDMCIITCSANLWSLGKVVTVSLETKEILGYTNTDLVGINVNKIMPDVFAKHHNSFIENFLESGDIDHINKGRVVFPVDKEGYLVPCSIILKVLPNLGDGLRIAGLLTRTNFGPVEVSSLTEGMCVDQQVMFVSKNDCDLEIRNTVYCMKLKIT